MPIFKDIGREPHSKIPNSVAQGSGLSPQALGVLTYLLSMPKDWDIRQSGVCAAFNITKRACGLIFGELEEKGFMDMRTLRKGKQFKGRAYDAFALPINTHGSIKKCDFHKASTEVLKSVTSMENGAVVDEKLEPQPLTEKNGVHGSINPWKFHKVILDYKETSETKTKETSESPLPPSAGKSGLGKDGGRNKSKMTKTEMKRMRVKQNDLLMMRIGSWFGRREDTLWTMEEAKALGQVNPSPQSVDLIEKYYTAKIDSSRNYRRRDIITLLNNWSGEEDRARGWLTKRNGHEKGKAVSSFNWDQKYDLTPNSVIGESDGQ